MNRTAEQPRPRVPGKGRAEAHGPGTPERPAGRAGGVARPASLRPRTPRGHGSLWPKDFRRAPAHCGCAAPGLPRRRAAPLVTQEAAPATPLTARPGCRGLLEPAAAQPPVRPAVRGCRGHPTACEQPPARRSLLRAKGLAGHPRCAHYDMSII